MELTKEMQQEWDDMVLHLHELSPEGRAELVEQIGRRNPELAGKFKHYFETPFFLHMAAAFKEGKSLPEALNAWKGEVNADKQ